MSKLFLRIVVLLVTFSLVAEASFFGALSSSAVTAKDYSDTFLYEDQALARVGGAGVVHYFGPMAKTGKNLFSLFKRLAGLIGRRAPTPQVRVIPKLDKQAMETYLSDMDEEVARLEPRLSTPYYEKPLATELTDQKGPGVEFKKADKDAPIEGTLFVYSQIVRDAMNGVPGARDTLYLGILQERLSRTATSRYDPNVLWKVALAYIRVLSNERRSDVKEYLRSHRPYFPRQCQIYIDVYTKMEQKYQDVRGDYEALLRNGTARRMKDYITSRFESETRSPFVEEQEPSPSRTQGFLGWWRARSTLTKIAILVAPAVVLGALIAALYVHSASIGVPMDVTPYFPPPRVPAWVSLAYENRIIVDDKNFRTFGHIVEELQKRPELAKLLHGSLWSPDAIVQRVWETIQGASQVHSGTLSVLQPHEVLRLDRLYELAEINNTPPNSLLSPVQVSLPNTGIPFMMASCWGIVLPFLMKARSRLKQASELVNSAA